MKRSDAKPSLLIDFMYIMQAQQEQIKVKANYYMTAASKSITKSLIL